VTTFADARVELACLVRRIERVVAERDGLRARGARPEYDAKERSLAELRRKLADVARDSATRELGNAA
jgi:hypothetical protein